MLAAAIDIMPYMFTYAAELHILIKIRHTVLPHVWRCGTKYILAAIDTVMMPRWLAASYAAIIRYTLIVSHTRHTARYAMAP